jgi:hypothetical protein
MACGVGGTRLGLGCLRPLALALPQLVLISDPAFGQSDSEDDSARRGTAVEEASSAADTYVPKLSGFLQLDYRSAISADGASDQEANVRRLRLKVEGAIAPRLRYTVEFQGDGLEPDSAGVIDARFDLMLSERWSLRAGQFKYDFDIEQNESDLDTHFADRSYASALVAGSLHAVTMAGRAAAAARDRGAALRGRGAAAGLDWSCAVGLFQGAGRGGDNNDAVSTTLNFRIARGGLRFNAGYLRSPTTDAGAPASIDYSAWTAAAELQRGIVFVRGEVYAGTRERDPEPERLGGYYALAGLALSRKLELLVRQQRAFDQRFASGGNAIRSIDVGARWRFAPGGQHHGTTLALNYLIRSADGGVSSGLTSLNDGRGAPLSSGADLGDVLIARLQLVF